MSTIISVKRVANNSLQAELIDQVSTSGRINVLRELNKGDARFNTGNPRHMWFPVTIASLIDLGFSGDMVNAISKLEYGQKIECKFESPKVDGLELRIQVEETVIPNEYEAKNTLKAAKQLPISADVAKNKGMSTDYDLSKYIGQPGYFMHNGQFIFSRTRLAVEGQVQHTTLEAKFVPINELADYGAELHPPVKQEGDEFAEKKAEDSAEEGA